MSFEISSNPKHSMILCFYTSKQQLSLLLFCIQICVLTMTGCYNHTCFKHRKQDTRTQHFSKIHMQLHLCAKEARNFSSVCSFFQEMVSNFQEAKPDTSFTFHSDYRKITEPSYLATRKSKAALQHLLWFLSLLLFLYCLYKPHLHRQMLLWKSPALTV